MSPVKVLVLWADPDSPNLGVRALAQGIRDLLPDSASVTFASHRKPLDSGSLSLKRLGIAAVWPWGQVKSELAQYDLIIDVGEGDSFASIYGAKRFAKMLAGKLAAANALISGVNADFKAFRLLHNGYYPLNKAASSSKT